jgi:hypothetical protein
MPQASWNNLRVLVPLLATSLLALDVAVLVARGQDPSVGFSDSMLVKTLAALAVSQVCLATCWIGLGEKSTACGLGLLLAVLAVWTGGSAVLLNFDPGMLLYLIVVALSTLAGWAVTTGLGFHLVLLDTSRPANQCTASPKPGQYSLGNLFVWTTFVAILAFTLRFPHVTTSLVLVVLWLSWPLSLTALLSIRTALAPGPVGRRILTLILVSPLLGAAPRIAALHEAWLENAILCEMHGLLLFSYLWIFRLGGYRLARSQTSSAARSSCVA